jgi:hypothetical protein
MTKTIIRFSLAMWLVMPCAAQQWPTNEIAPTKTLDSVLTPAKPSVVKLPRIQIGSGEVVGYWRNGTNVTAFGCTVQQAYAMLGVHDFPAAASGVCCVEQARQTNGMRYTFVDNSQSWPCDYTLWHYVSGKWCPEICERGMNGSAIMLDTNYDDPFMWITLTPTKLW